uniref:Uncharacterized protein n=1 Tax=Anguilla anguilla TaxID=7936 RepID=A0A0E9QD17_ANGAN
MEFKFKVKCNSLAIMIHLLTARQSALPHSVI